MTHQLTQADRAKGGRNSKGRLNAKTYGKRLIASVMKVRDPEEIAAVLKKYGQLPSGVELPKEVAIEMVKFSFEADRRLSDQLLIDTAKQESAIELLQKKEDQQNRKMVLSKQLGEFNAAQIENVYNATIEEMKESLRAEMYESIRAEIITELSE